MRKRLSLVPRGRTLVMTGQAVEPAVIGSMEQYVEHMGEVPAGFMFYLILSGDRARTRRELATMQALLERYPGTALQLGLGYGGQLSGNSAESLALLAGRYDAELQSLAEWLQSLDRAVFLRPLYEFDRACATYGEPQLFQRAYRYIVDHLREAGAGHNVSWVWHSAGPGYRLDRAGFYAIMGSVSQSLGQALDPILTEAEGPGPDVDFCPVADFYPGDGYVDYFAISYWGQGSFLGPGTRDAKVRYERAVRRLLDEGRELGLPLMIGESTPAYIGTTSGRASVAWMKRFFTLIEEYDIRRVLTSRPSGQLRAGTGAHPRSTDSSRPMRGCTSIGRSRPFGVNAPATGGTASVPTPTSTRCSDTNLTPRSSPGRRGQRPLGSACAGPTARLRWCRALVVGACRRCS